MSTAPNERIEVVDVLRAFALFGIMVTHSGMEFLVGPPPYPNFGLVHPFDAVVQQVISLLTTSRARTPSNPGPSEPMRTL